MQVGLPVGAFLSAILVVIPLPWHWRAGSVPTISMSLWLFVSNFILGINSILWGDDVRMRYLVWCDINTKLQVGSNIALSASIFAICLQLERVSSVRHVSTSKKDKRQRQFIDIFLCIGVPMIYMALHYVVQGHRFDIMEIYGCRPYIYKSLASLFLISLPPLVFDVGAVILSVLAFRHFWIRRLDFSRHLANSNSTLTTNRYFRLMVMTMVQMFLGISVTMYNLVFTYRDGLRPWTSWADVHFNFSRVTLYPMILIPQQDRALLAAAWWAIPVSGYIYFSFFGFSEDAIRNYKAIFVWIGRTIFRIPDAPTKGSKLYDTFPSSYSRDNSHKLSTMSIANNVLRDPKYDSPPPSSCKVPDYDAPAYDSAEHVPYFAPYPIDHEQHRSEPQPGPSPTRSSFVDSKSTTTSRHNVDDDVMDIATPPHAGRATPEVDPESLVAPYLGRAI